MVVFVPYHEMLHPAEDSHTLSSLLPNIDFCCKPGIIDIQEYTIWKKNPALYTVPQMDSLTYLNGLTTQALTQMQHLLHYFIYP